MPNITNPCHCCGAEDLYEFPEYGGMWRVTSDCKSFEPGGRLAVCNVCGAVQKPTDAKWQSEIEMIYREYSPYFQSSGIEQAVFDPSHGKPRRRSTVILGRLHETHPIASSGRMIDVGCGNGVMLSAFADFRDGWDLYGHELSDLHIEKLKTIPGFDGLYTGDLEDLPGHYHLITMIHALEHFPDPYEGLAQLKDKIDPEGCLFIEIPNAAVTPFDLMIADHVSHFARQDLARLLGRAGMGAKAIADDWVTKELSVVATPSGPVVDLPPSVEPAAARARVQGQLDWINAVTSGAQEAARGPGKLGLFGTSVAAMWLHGQIADMVDFFVDEDPSRKGTTLFDRPVYTPSEVPDGGIVYLALIPPVAKAVAERLQRPLIEYRVPPNVESRSV
ncbi:MAG: class I SAM-dependent methyltransferase [Pseudomonadota bacterium]